MRYISKSFVLLKLLNIVRSFLLVKVYNYLSQGFSCILQRKPKHIEKTLLRVKIAKWSDT